MLSEAAESGALPPPPRASLCSGNDSPPSTDTRGYPGIRLSPLGDVLRCHRAQPASSRFFSSVKTRWVFLHVVSYWSLVGAAFSYCRGRLGETVRGGFDCFGKLSGALFWHWLSHALRLNGLHT